MRLFNINFSTSSQFIRYCYKNNISTNDTAHLLREHWNMKNVEIGNALEWYYKEESNET